MLLNNAKVAKIVRIFVFMKYLLRSVKYFFYMALILALVIVALIAFKVVEADISAIFVDGWKSIWKIAVMLLFFALIYPRFGFGKRTAHLKGSTDEVEPLVMQVMGKHGYVLVKKSDDETLYFRRKDHFSRAVKMWEDSVIFTRSALGYDVEGLSRDLNKIVTLVEAQQEYLEEGE